MEPPKITSPRPLVIGRIADHLTVQRPGHPLRVGIDGITASGKTTFAAELVRAVRDRGRPVVEVSFDDYHHPRERGTVRAGSRPTATTKTRTTPRRFGGRCSTGW